MQSYFFYDLETSDLSPRGGRIMQFAGQRTDLDLNLVGEPFNILIKLTPDVVPSPDAILVTGITPQSTLADGITEVEFLEIFNREIATPDTIFVGFNSVRFDDEFMRFLLWRNFYDAYEWQWKDGRSRWDILDVVRMTRALRPDGIEWPVVNGKPTNRLELLTKLNGLDHANAHDALSDVLATIAVAKLIKDKQPELYDFLLGIRSKNVVRERVLSTQPFVYTSGRYSGEFLNTTVAMHLAETQDGALVYDLRVDPDEITNLSAMEIYERWTAPYGSDLPRLPIKTMKFNHCPAVAPLGVIKDDATWQRLGLSLDKVNDHRNKLRAAAADLGAKMTEVINRIDNERADKYKSAETLAENALYDGFVDGADKSTMRALHSASPDELGNFASEFNDARLKALVPLYKARNFPRALSDEERATWDEYVRSQIFDGGQSSKLAKFFARLEDLSNNSNLTDSQRYLLEELQLYGQSLMPDEY